MTGLLDSLTNIISPVKEVSLDEQKTKKYSIIITAKSSSDRIKPIHTTLDDKFQQKCTALLNMGYTEITIKKEAKK